MPAASSATAHPGPTLDPNGGDGGTLLGNGGEGYTYTAATDPTPGGAADGGNGR